MSTPRCVKPREPMHAPTGKNSIRVRVSRNLEPLFDQFLAIQHHRLVELEQALTAKDLPTLQRLGHAIKGGAATYEIPEAANLGALLEQAAAANDLPATGRCIALIREYFTALVVTFFP
ncbi:MAG: Hpt domain-containing protein [Desulfovibrionaceae bacterium]